MGDKIKSISIEGFKSIRKMDLELRNLNVLIGANGAGKSNFVDFFHLLHEMVEQRLQLAVGVGGGADIFLHFGPKVTKAIELKARFGQNAYEFVLTPTVDNRLIFASENTVYYPSSNDRVAKSQGAGHTEAKLKEIREDPPTLRQARYGPPHYIYKAVSNWVVYHFHDTSLSAYVRGQKAINDNEFLRQDAENLAAFLFKLRQTKPMAYQKIRDVVRLAAPFFDDFKLRPVTANPELIQLEWAQVGSDYPFRPSQLSDGTLRFICLATALLQPNPPATMLFDEPELGLHPYALALLASLFKQAATSGGQVIVCTQSAALLNEFEPEDVIVVDREDGQSTFRRLEKANLSEWLENYSLGELWQKNIFGGRPHGDSGNGPPDSENPDNPPSEMPGTPPPEGDIP